MKLKYETKCSTDRENWWDITYKVHLLEISFPKEISNKKKTHFGEVFYRHYGTVHKMVQKSWHQGATSSCFKVHFSDEQIRESYLKSRTSIKVPPRPDKTKEKFVNSFIFSMFLPLLLLV